MRAYHQWGCEGNIIESFDASIGVHLHHVERVDLSPVIFAVAKKTCVSFQYKLHEVSVPLQN